MKVRLKWMQAIAMLMAMEIKNNRYDLERVPSALRKQVEDNLKELGDD